MDEEAEKLKAICEEGVEVEANLDRRLLVQGDQMGVKTESKEDEFVFDEEAPEEALLLGWFAVARFYSGHNLPVKVIFMDLFRIWGDGSTRDLGDNSYLLEFSSENALNFELRGGPWGFKGDAIIVVRYDGLRKLRKWKLNQSPCGFASMTYQWP